MLTIAGLAVGLLGLVAGLLNLLGYFADKKKAALADAIRNSDGGIPRQTPGFEKFMASFPPPSSVLPSSVSHIVKDVIQTHDRFPVSITVRYLAGNQRTPPVATYEDVRRWAEHTGYGWLVWLITAAGWVTVAIDCLIQFLGKN